MDTFEFKIKCFCLVIFLLAFSLFTKAQVDPHSPTPAEPVVAMAYEFSIPSKTNNELKANLYIEENKYFFYSCSFSNNNSAAILELLTKELGKPVFAEGEIKKWDTMNGKPINSLYIFFDQGRMKIKCSNLENGMLEKLQNLMDRINEIVGAEIVANNDGLATSSRI